MGQQLRPQFEGECPDAVPPRLRRIGEPVVVDTAEQVLRQTLHHCGLVPEIGVHRVGRDADSSRDTPDGDRVRAAFGEQRQRRVEDGLLTECPPRTRATSPCLGHVSSWSVVSEYLWTAYSYCTSYRFKAMT